ncbi:hypothetical protein KC963_04370 [Candidatus Saccharibacteria bacterium]|nr:hypothetical protein [Candidatus Saccharibacteria bacterium]
MKRNQTGFAHFAIVLVLMVIAVVVGVGYYVLSKNRDSSQSSQSASYNRNESGSSTDCPDPLLVPPVDTEKVTSILYPGQTRGGQYKPHGGFRMDGSSNAVEVKAPMDAKLVAGSRYIEQGEQQVLLDFQTSCGVNFRFDHLLTLSPEIQAVVDTLPPAKPDDSRTTNFDEQISVKTGDVIATAVGFAKTNNAAFDFGVYDTRQPNSASKDSKYKAAHPDLDNNEQLKYAVCWLDLFSPAIANTLKALPAGDQASGKSSDYCI